MSTPSAQATPGSALDRSAAASIRMVMLDVDGVLSEGGIWVGLGPADTSIELKRFDVRDGLGVKMLMWAGIEVAWISGRVSESTTLRAGELGIEECHQTPGAHKIDVINEIMMRKGISWSDIAYLGDDLPDLPVLRRVGLPAAVHDATSEVKAAARWVGTLPGGRGAVREFAEALLRARGEWDGLVERYCNERAGSAAEERA